MTDTYPPNEVGDIPTPTYGAVNAPHTYSVINFPGDRENTQHKKGYREIEAHIPHAARLLFNRTHNFLSYLMVRLFSVY
jgi:hypothetical protein